MVVDLVVLVEGDVGAGARGEELAFTPDDTVARNRRLNRRLGTDSECCVAHRLELECERKVKTQFDRWI